jgi:hypothetical protein
VCEDTVCEDTVCDDTGWRELSENPGSGVCPSGQGIRN